MSKAPILILPSERSLRARVALEHAVDGGKLSGVRASHRNRVRTRVCAHLPYVAMSMRAYFPLGSATSAWSVASK